MALSGHNGGTVPEGQAIGLFRVIHRAFGHDMARGSRFIKYPVSHRKFSHGLPAIRSRDRRIKGQLLSLLLGDLDISRVKLPIAIGLYRPEQISDNLFLPVNQFERMAGPGPLGVAQALDEGYGVICQFLVIGGRFGFEFGGLVLFKFPHGASLLS